MVFISYQSIENVFTIFLTLRLICYIRVVAWNYYLLIISWLEAKFNLYNYSNSTPRIMACVTRITAPIGM